MCGRIYQGSVPGRGEMARCSPLLKLGEGAGTGRRLVVTGQ